MTSAMKNQTMASSFIEGDLWKKITCWSSVHPHHWNSWHFKACAKTLSFVFFSLHDKIFRFNKADSCFFNIIFFSKLQSNTFHPNPLLPKTSVPVVSYCIQYALYIFCLSRHVKNIYYMAKSITPDYHIHIWVFHKITHIHKEVVHFAKMRDNSVKPEDFIEQ